MKTKMCLQTMRRIWAVCVLAIIIAAATVGARLANHYHAGGSFITNADGFAAAHIAAGLRTVRH